MRPKLPIFMDHQSTTPMDPKVLEAMLPYFSEHFGNAASRNHSLGWTAEKASEEARQDVANLIGATGKEIVWTSGATEANNLAIKGAAEFYRDKGNHIITSQIEHKAVLDTCKRLESMGYKLTYLPVQSDGRIDPLQVEQAITHETILVSIMWANNEIGSVNDLKSIGAITRKKGVLFHTDAVQGVGKMPFDADEFGVDMVSMTAHKMYGPKGIGALYVRRKPRVRLVQQIDGGGHERGMRSGTLNIPGIVGFAQAAKLAMATMKEEGQRIYDLRERLRTKIMTSLDDVFINGSMEHRLPGNLNLSFGYVEGEGLMMALKDVAVSSGSACTSASLEPSYVLRALGIGEELAHSSIRFGLGRFTTQEEVDYVANLVIEKVNKLREMSPLWEMKQEGIDLRSVVWTGHH